MIVYMITHHDSGHADLVRIILDVRFEVKAFPFRPNWLYLPLLRNKDAMIVYTITRYDTGHADLVRVILDVRFEVKAFQSRPHWVYFFTREKMSVSHTQHR